LTFHANGYQIHGSGLSREHIDNLMTVSHIEALATTRPIHPNLGMYQGNVPQDGARLSRVPRTRRCSIREA
jgi:hypothetical protein